MEENKMQNEQSETKQENVEGENNYIEAIKEIKAKTVSRDAYEKVQAENRELLSALINGKQVDIEQETEEKVDINELRKVLFTEDCELSNLEYVTKALQLRDALIENGEPDPFLPWGKRIAPDDDDIAKANKAAEALKHCVEFADGNSEVFTNELQRITVDTPVLRQKQNYRR